jgi:hypothetical protein
MVRETVAPVETKAAERLDRLIKLYPRISTEQRNEPKGMKRRNGCGRPIQTILKGS